jgi:hypothetical protein
MLLSVHIPKCGGTSFQQVLRGVYGERRLWLNYGTIFSQEDARQRSALMPPGIRCVHGRFLGDAFDEVRPEAEVVTWLRHPVERVISLYHHFLRQPDPHDPSCRALWSKSLRLEDFAALPPRRNEMTRYLAGKPDFAFAFVGVTERFEESLRVFSATFGLGLHGPAPLANVNPRRSLGRYPVADAVRARLEELNRDDLAAYRDAVERLDQSLVWLDRLGAVRPVRPADLSSPAGPGGQARLAGSSAFSLSR